MILPTIAWALLTAAFLWVVYMALEPFVRRRWPGRIISWTRLLAGDVRDPMVCRDLLIGALFGVGGLLWGVLRYQVPVWLGHPPGRPFVPDNWWLGAGSFLPFLGHQVMSSLMIGLIAIFVLLFCRLSSGATGWPLLSAGPLAPCLYLPPFAMFR